MSAPRRFFGRNPPGRLAGTMLRALAAEMSDPGRYSRGKQYARDGAVVDIAIEPGLARGQVQGTRFDPYVAMLYVQPLPEDDLARARDSAVATALLIPSRSEIAAECTCPDGDTSGAGALCKHALATMLVLADEVTIEPDGLLRWRSGIALDAPARVVAAAPTIDVLATALRAPTPLPADPVVTPLVHRWSLDDTLADALDSALTALSGRTRSSNRGSR